MQLASLLAKPIVVKNMKLPIGDQQPDAKDVPLALEDGNPNSSSDSSSDSDSSSSSSEEDAPMENSSDSSDKDKQIAKLQEDSKIERWSSIQIAYVLTRPKCQVFCTTV